MHSKKVFLDKLVSYWDWEANCFMILGEWLEITLHDVYFLTDLLVLGVIGDTTSKLPRGVLMDDIFYRNCYASENVHNSYILVSNI